MEHSRHKRSGVETWSARGTNRPLRIDSLNIWGRVIE